MLRAGGLLVCLLPEPRLTGWEVVGSYPISLAGQHPRIVVARR